MLTADQQHWNHALMRNISIRTGNTNTMITKKKWHDDCWDGKKHKSALGTDRVKQKRAGIHDKLDLHVIDAG